MYRATSLATPPIPTNGLALKPSKLLVGSFVEGSKEGIISTALGYQIRQFQNYNYRYSLIFPLESLQGQVYINGVGLGQVQDWYARKIGYVLQLAVPYYEELTVRQNLFFAAHMRLPKKMSHSRKFERVEQILAEVCHSLRPFSSFLRNKNL